MSTDYYRVCEKCLAEVKHYHIRSDMPVAHTWFGGQEKGLQVDIDETLVHSDDSVQLLSEHDTNADDGEQRLVTVGELRSYKGLGKSPRL